MDDESGGFETELDAYRDRAEKPLWRLFKQYGHGERHWLAVGLVTSVFTYAALLVTPLVLGTTIDAVFTQESAYALPLVPESWLPDARAAQFWLSTTVIGAALLGGAVLQWVRGVSINSVRIENAPNPVALEGVDGSIEYDDVRFAYEGEEAILDGVDIEVEAGETVALVGATGAGKSTVAKLLLRLYDVDGGPIRIDGHDVRDVALSDLRSSRAASASGSRSHG